MLCRRGRRSATHPPGAEIHGAEMSPASAASFSPWSIRRLRRREAAPQYSLEDRLGLDADPRQRSMSDPAMSIFVIAWVDVSIDEPGHHVRPGGGEARYVVARRHALPVQSDFDDVVASTRTLDRRRAAGDEVEQHAPSITNPSHRSRSAHQAPGGDATCRPRGGHSSLIGISVRTFADPDLVTGRL